MELRTSGHHRIVHGSTGDEIYVMASATYDIIGIVEGSAFCGYIQCIQWDNCVILHVP